MNRNLKGYRTMLGMTQTEMAKKIGMVLSTYSFKETGKADFTQTEMEDIKKIINEKYPELTTDEIFLRT